MSLSSVLAELRTKLDAISGLSEHPDRRDASLADASGNLDGAYKIRVGWTGTPWPETATTPRAWSVDVTLEMGQMLGNDHSADAIQEDALTREVRRSLQYEAMTAGTVWNLADPTVTAVPNTRLRLWSWAFRLRYQE